MTEQEIREQIEECRAIAAQCWAMGGLPGWIAASTVLLGLRLAMVIRTKGRTSW